MDVAVAAPPMGFSATQFGIHTAHARQFIDLTERVADCVSATGVSSGLVIVSSQHTTASIVVNEHEPELLKDLDAMLSRLAPESNEYAHNAVPCPPTEKPNGHAHCQGLLLNASVSLPVAGGRLSLGKYQRVFLVELDCARPRLVSVLVMGTGA